jgi:hypothetical protein
VTRPPPTTSTGSVRTSPNAPNASTIRSTVRSVFSVSRTVTGNTVSAMPWWSK